MRLEILSTLKKVLRRICRLFTNTKSNTFKPWHENRFLCFFYPGHFYTPIPDPKFVDENADFLFNSNFDEIEGINLNLEKQISINQSFLTFKEDYTPSETEEAAKNKGARYFTKNPFFNDYDAFVLYGMLRLYKPGRFFEVGSGFSSALALDVCETFLNPMPSFTFIEPNSERLQLLIKNQDWRNLDIIEKPVQEVPQEKFKLLVSGDILFIDSSHVSKIGSDVNFLLLSILPILKKGVIVHIHDIFWPFEYPKEWFDEGRSWNEAYILRALLTNTERYSIIHFNSYLASRHKAVTVKLPAWGKPGKAQSLWLEIK
jgi:hypothetical protein